MAHEEHLRVLKLGTHRWNEWRRGNALSHPNLRGAHLRGADLMGTHLGGADLIGANLQGADLSGAVLREASLIEANLSRANLNLANLREAKLHGADLSGADLSGASLIETDLHNANLHEANLHQANLHGANLHGADLSGASLIETDLHNANLHEANLHEANISGAALAGTILADLDLRGVCGLEEVVHRGPSTIGIDTLFRSKGEIPNAFLRGCGVPEVLVTYAASLVGKPFEYNSCFLSYSHKDEEFAKRLHSRMQAETLRVWFAPKDIAGGKKLHDQIDAAIRIQDKLLVVLSSSSMASEWVKTEIYKARQREIKEKRQVLFPISIASFEEIRSWEYFDTDTGKDLARELREFFIPDFSNWKDHDTFEKTFAGLLRDLRATEAKTD